MAVQAAKRNLLIACTAFSFVGLLLIPLEWITTLVKFSLGETNFSKLQYFNPLILKLGLSGIPLFIFCVSLFYKKVRYFLQWLNQKTTQSFSELRKLTREELLGLIGVMMLIVVLRIYSISHYMLNVDEAWLYQAYGEKNPFIVFGWFPLPSNHVFHSFWAGIGSFFVSNNPIVGMRIPSVCIGIITSFLMFIFVYRKKGFVIAMITLIVFNSIESVVWSQTAARGYGFLMFFYLVNLIAIEQWRKSRDNNYLILLTISSVLGAYTTLSFFYYVFAFLFVLFIHDKRKALKVLLITGYVLLLVYSPILGLNGFSPFLEYPKGESDVVAFFTSLVGAFNWSFFGIGAFLFPFLFLFSLREARSNKLYYLLFFTPLIVAFTHGTQPAGKIWTPQMVVISMLLASSLSERRVRFKSYIPIVTGMLILSIAQYSFFKSTNRWYPQLKYEYGKSLLSSVSVFDSCVTLYSNDDYFLMVAEYYKKVNGWKYQLRFPQNEQELDKDAVLVINENKEYPDVRFEDKLQVFTKSYYQVWVKNPTR